MKVCHTLTSLRRGPRMVYHTSIFLGCSPMNGVAYLYVPRSWIPDPGSRIWNLESKTRLWHVRYPRDMGPCRIRTSHEASTPPFWLQNWYAHYAWQTNPDNAQSTNRNDSNRATSQVRNSHFKYSKLGWFRTPVLPCSWAARCGHKTTLTCAWTERWGRRT